MKPSAFLFISRQDNQDRCLIEFPHGVNAQAAQEYAKEHLGEEFVLTPLPACNAPQILIRQTAKAKVEEKEADNNDDPRFAPAEDSDAMGEDVEETV